MQEVNHATRKRGLSPGQENEAGPSKMAKVTTIECFICCEKVPASSIFMSRCCHTFCQDCLQKFFRESLQEAKFPATCCDRPIPEIAHQYLSPDLVDNLRQKKIEYATPMAERLFCPGCGSIILPANVDKKTMKGHCDECDKVTCAHCKNFDHEGSCRRPSEDLDVAALKKLSREESWVACYKCGQTIEKSEDCDHITQDTLPSQLPPANVQTNPHPAPTSCLCGTQFCYQCGAEWKTCNCFHPEFTLTGPVNANFRRAYLEDSSEQDADEDMQDAEPQETIAAQVVRETERHLAIAAPRPQPLFPPRNWNCMHQNRGKNRWNGPYNCADCPNIQPSFIWECRDCKIMMCGRCVKLYDGWDFWEEPYQGRAKGGNQNRGVNGGTSGALPKKNKKNPKEGRKGREQWRKDARDVLEGNFGNLKK